MSPDERAQGRDWTRGHYSRSPRQRLLRAAGLALLLGGGAWLGIALVRLWTAASTVRADLNLLQSTVENEIQALDLNQVLSLLETTHRDLETLQATARPLLWLAPYVGWVPRYGPDIQAAPALLEIALDLTAAGQETLRPVLSLWRQATAQGEREQIGQRQAALASLQAAQPQLNGALSSVHRARAARDGIEVDRLNPQVQTWVRRLDQYLPLLEQGIKATLSLPGLLGVDSPHTYLMLIQNEDELRATGGFISAVARMTFDSGSIIELEFEDSYAIDDFSRPYPPPPKPLLEYMLAELWLFRDSNWSPNFSTSAQAAIDLYAISRDVRIDGVIALDQKAIRWLIEALGPLHIEGHSEPITGRNVTQMARQAWNPGDRADNDWWRQRKDFMSLVLTKVILRLDSEPDPATLVRLLYAARQAFDEKHLLAWTKDPKAAVLMAELAWDGAILSVPGDYLMVVDANLGFNKANALVQQSLAYTIDLSDLARPQATLTVQHKHLSKQRGVLCRHEPRYDATYEQMMERCYWDYMRVYAPLGAQLESATPHAVSGLELLSGRPNPAQVINGPPERDRAVFATFLMLRRGETLETRFEYVLPQEILHVQGGRVEYVLTAQKQPGTMAIPLHVQVLLPPQLKVGISEPEPTWVSASYLEYDLTLNRDQVLRLVLRQGK